MMSLRERLKARRPIEVFDPHEPPRWLKAESWIPPRVGNEVEGIRCGRELIAANKDRAKRRVILDPHRASMGAKKGAATRRRYRQVFAEMDRQR